MTYIPYAPCNMTINFSQIQENMPWTTWFKSWPFYPRSLEVTIYLWKGHLTIPKGAQRIARCFRFLWYCLKIYPCSCFIHIFNHDTFWQLIHHPYFLHNTPNFHEFSSHFKNTENPKIPLESSHGLHLPPPVTVTTSCNLLGFGDPNLNFYLPLLGDPTYT